MITVVPSLHVNSEMNQIPIRNIWLLLLYASELFQIRGTAQVDIEDIPDNVPDTIAELLTFAVEERLSQNLHRAYERQSGILDRVRGEIDLLRTESRQLIRQGKVACRYEDLTIDTLRNRYVRGALEVIAHSVTSHQLTHRCLTLARQLQSMGVGDLIPTIREVSADRLGRHDAKDRFMLAVARLAYDLALPTESSGEYLLGDPERDIRWLRKLFERAVYGFYNVVLTPRGWSVSRGKVLHWQVDSSTAGISTILPSMKTDIELSHRNTGRKIVIDTKFTSLLKPAQYRETISSGYLYQIYSYVRSQVDVLPAPNLAEGVLLHPTIDNSINEAALIQGHIFRFTTVDLSGQPSEFRNRLLELVDGSPLFQENRQA